MAEEEWRTDREKKIERKGAKRQETAERVRGVKTAGQKE